MKNLNKDDLNTLCEIKQRCATRNKKQLATLNRLRKMNGKQIVSSFAEHKNLKKQGL